ncbi:MAG: hypothetical protein AB4063_17235 [Crocosphaera sp.]
MKPEILNSKLWIAFLLYSLLPLFPFFIELLTSLFTPGKSVKAETFLITTSMYLIGKGIANENFLFFVVFLLIAIILLPLYGLLIATSTPNQHIFMIISIIFLTLVIVYSFLENYKIYVIECRPLEIKFIKNLISLTNDVNQNNNV